MVGNFNTVIENEGLLKVTGSHVHCKCGNIYEKYKLETVLGLLHSINS